MPQQVGNANRHCPEDRMTATATHPETGAALPPATARAASPGVVLAILSIAAFMASLDVFIVNVAFPDISRDFAGSSLADLSWVLTGYAVVFAALLVPM